MGSLLGRGVWGGGCLGCNGNLVLSSLIVDGRGLDVCSGEEIVKRLNLRRKLVSENDGPKLITKHLNRQVLPPIDRNQAMSIGNKFKMKFHISIFNGTAKRPVTFVCSAFKVQVQAMRTQFKITSRLKLVLRNERLMKWKGRTVQLGSSPRDTHTVRHSSSTP